MPSWTESLEAIRAEIVEAERLKLERDTWDELQNRYDKAWPMLEKMTAQIVSNAEIIKGVD